MVIGHFLFALGWCVPACSVTERRASATGEIASSAAAARARIDTKRRIPGIVELAMRGLIFDLDGTLVDTVYPHVYAWQRALEEAGMPIDGWRIHRRVGMSGGLFTRAVAREVGRDLSPGEAEGLQ